MSRYVVPMDLLCPFNPATDLTFTQPDTVLKMADIGLSETGISSVAVAGPFPLFSQGAVQEMRDELMSKSVLKSCKYGSDPSFQLRGACPTYAKFCYSVWRHPETLKTISQVAGVGLTPVMELEISHVNVHLKEDDGDGKPIIGWHEGSYPFVCIVMLSDTSSMVEGQLELKDGTGNIIKTSRMEQGWAIILQGRYVEHRVPYCADERITAVTSFRPSSPFLRDDTRLTTVRPISDTSRLYYEFFEYREIIVMNRLKGVMENLPEWSLSQLIGFIDELTVLLRQTREELREELVEEGGAVAGFISPQSPGFSATQPSESDSPTLPDKVIDSLRKCLTGLADISQLHVERLRVDMFEGHKIDSKSLREFITGKLSRNDRGSTFFNPRFMRLLTGNLLARPVQQVLREEPQIALEGVMKRMLASCEKILRKSSTNGPNFVGEDIWLRDEYNDHMLRDTIDTEINDLHNNQTNNEEEWVPPCLIRFLQCRMETVHIDKARNSKIHPRYPPIVESHQIKDANSMGISSEQWDNYHPDRNGYVYFDVCNRVQVENNWDPRRLLDLPLLRMFEGQKHILLSFITELKPEAVGDISGDALRKKVEHYLLTNGATYLHERLKLRARGSGKVFEVGDDFIIHLICGIGPQAYHYICRLRPASTKDQLDMQISRLEQERKKSRPTRQQARSIQESLDKTIAQLARGEEAFRYEIVLMGTYDLQNEMDRDPFRRLLNQINQVALSVQLQQMIEDISVAVHKPVNQADSDMAFYWKRDTNGNYKICWDNAPYVDDTHNDIYENLRPVLQSAPEEGKAVFDAQSAEIFAVAQGELDMTEDFQNLSTGGGGIAVSATKTEGAPTNHNFDIHLDKYHEGKCPESQQTP